MKLLGKFIYNKTLDIYSKSAFYFAIWTTSEYNQYILKRSHSLVIKILCFLIDESLFPVGGLWLWARGLTIYNEELISSCVNITRPRDQEGNN